MHVDKETGEILAAPVTFTDTTDQSDTDTFDMDQADLIFDAKLTIGEAQICLETFLAAYGIAEEAELDETLAPTLGELVETVRRVIPAIRDFTEQAVNFLEEIGPLPPRTTQGWLDTPALENWDFLDDYDASPYSATAREAAAENWNDDYDEGYVYHGTPAVLDRDLDDTPETEHDFAAANRAILAEMAKDTEDSREERENALKEIMGKMDGGIAL